MEMTDRGRELQFGVSVVPFADPPEFALKVTQAAEEAGLDLSEASSYSVLAKQTAQTLTEEDHTDHQQHRHYRRVVGVQPRPQAI